MSKKQGKPAVHDPATTGAHLPPLPGGAPPTFNPRMMDKMMRDITKLLEQQEFDTIEEANEFLKQFVGKPLPALLVDDDPLSQAQDLIYRAREAPSRTQAVKLARQALKISPDCADAYVLLAEAEAKTAEAARDYYRKGVEAGERALRPEAFEEDAGHFWGILETRPYMRSRLGLAEALLELGGVEAAIGHFRELLRLNPNDNQGVRYLLLDALFDVERDEEVAALLEQYANDHSANWLCARALLAFRQNGDSKEANAALDAALAHNAHVPAYLLGKKKLPRTMPAYVGFGDDNEAVDYASTGLAHWLNTHGAVAWLRRHATALG